MSQKLLLRLIYAAVAGTSFGLLVHDAYCRGGVHDACYAVCGTAIGSALVALVTEEAPSRPDFLRAARVRS